jgi:hypothetical protein
MDWNEGHVARSCTPSWFSAVFRRQGTGPIRKTSLPAMSPARQVKSASLNLGAGGCGTPCGWGRARRPRDAPALEQTEARPSRNFLVVFFSDDFVLSLARGIVWPRFNVTLYHVAAGISRYVL